MLQATGPLQQQLKAKVDLDQLHSSSNNLEAKFSSKEKSVLLGLKSIGDKTALLLQHKADAAAFDAWKQQLAEDLSTMNSQLQLHALTLQSVQHSGSASADGRTPCSAPALGAARHTGEEQWALQAFAALLGGSAGDPDSLPHPETVASSSAAAAATANDATPAVTVLPLLTAVTGIGQQPAVGMSKQSGVVGNDQVATEAALMPVLHPGSAAAASVESSACPLAAQQQLTGVLLRVAVVRQQLWCGQ